MNDDALNGAVLAVAKALESAAVPYAIGGAIAYGYWGAVRATRDVDVNVFLPGEAAATALEALLQGGLELDLKAATASASERGDAKAFWNGVPVDLFFNSIPLHDSAAARARIVTFQDRSIPVLSAEDTIVLKLLFYRPKDLLDIERLVALKRGAVDFSYVDHWLEACVGADDSRVRWWSDLLVALGLRG